MPTRSQLSRSKQIHRRTGRTFYLATRFFPTDVREPTHVLYAFFRLADDVVDTTESREPADQRRELDHLRDVALGRSPTDDPVLEATADLVETADIPAAEVEQFIDAMLADVEHQPVRSRAELDRYMRGSSVAVANMMLAVMDPPEKDRARPHAAALAEAFQLTNFLRDVREDIRDYGRVYLPGDVRTSHGVTIDQLRDGRADGGFRRAIRAELARTERRYRTGVAGIELLPTGVQFPILAAAILYADYHRVIVEQDYDVLSSRPALSTWRKLSLVSRARLHWALSGDPVAVFERLAPLDRGGVSDTGVFPSAEPVSD